MGKEKQNRVFVGILNRYHRLYTNSKRNYKQVTKTKIQQFSKLKKQYSNMDYKQLDTKNFEAPFILPQKP